MQVFLKQENFAISILSVNFAKLSPLLPLKDGTIRKRRR